MEASVAQGTQADEQAQAAPATDAQAQEQQAATPDLSEQFADLSARMAKVEGGEQAASDDDLFTALFGAEQGEVPPQTGQETTQGDEQLTAEDISTLQALGVDVDALGIDTGQATQQAQPQGDPRVDALQAQLQQMSEREHAREMAAIQQEFPDIMKPEIQGPLKAQLTNFAQQYGDQIAQDPSVVRTVYKAIKAEQADAAGGTADEAAAQGASLETNAGRSQKGGTDPSEEVADMLLRASGGSAFTQ